MKRKKRQLLYVFLLAGLSGLHAQQLHEALPATGGTASGSGGIVSFTAGEVGFTTISEASSGTVAQGIQQAYEIYVVSGIEQDTKAGLAITVYPNPAEDQIILKVSGDIKTDYQVSLYNLKGELLRNNIMENNQSKISINKLPSAAYFLKVTEEGREIKTITFIKK